MSNTNGNNEPPQVSTGIKQPALLKLWSDMTACKLDEKKWRALAPTDENGAIIDPTTTNNIAGDDEMTLSQQTSCRGLYKRITDLMQDGYIAYKTKEIRKQQQQQLSDQQQQKQEAQETLVQNVKIHHFSQTTSSTRKRFTMDDEKQQNKEAQE